MSAVSVQPAAWCPGGAEAFHTSFSEPGGTAAHVVGWALEYLYPLNTWLDQLVGDKAGVQRLSAQWTLAASQLDEVEAGCESTLRSIATMQGKSIRAMRHAVEDIRSTALNASEWADASAASLELASRIVAAVHDAVVGALSELASLVVSLFDVSLSISSLNPLDKMHKLANLTRSVDRFVSVIERLIDEMFDAFEALVRLLQRLGPLIQEAIDRLRELASRIADVAGLPIGILVGTAAGSLLGPLGALVGGVLGGVLGDTGGGVLSDWLSSSPYVTEIDGTDLSGDDKQLSAYRDAMGCRSLDSLQDFIIQNGNTDTMGGEDRTVIDIKKVVGDDGAERWVVSLPSTQDWNILKGLFNSSEWNDMLADYPATNDLDTNVALMLADHPEIATQYQRGVYEAMRQAGVPAGADVVYSGFSQGGIMAASLASDVSTPYSVVGIMTTGAPIDRFDIPADVTVAAFGHRSDPVAALDEIQDGVGRGVIGAGVVTGNPGLVVVGDSMLKGHAVNSTVILDNPDKPTGPDNQVPSVHSTAGYAQTVSEWEAENPAEAARLTQLLGGTVVDHQTYAFSE